MLVRTVSTLIGCHRSRCLSSLSAAVVAVWLGLAAEAVAQGSAATDRAVLEALYDATGGASWTDSTNWKTPAALHEWYGVRTDAAGRVTDLALYNNGLTGRIPRALGRLTHLEWLDLYWNDLSGPIPGELGNLVELEYLSLARNDLSGSIPGELGNLVNLTRGLNLDFNDLSGPIPSELGNLVNLTGMNLSWNTLSGPIPDELGNLVNLEGLTLFRNALTGPVPAWLGNLTQLKYLTLGANELSGGIPSVLGDLANLESLTLLENDLSGPIPGELGNLVNLGWLNLSFNDLSGPIPDELGSLVNLTGLFLNENDLSGPVPAWLGNLTGLQRLSLYKNDLSGSIPGELGGLVNLEELYLSHNWALSGPLPTGLPRLNLTDLDIFMTGVCAPGAYREWLKTIEFRGVLCGAPTDVTVDLMVVYTPAAREAAGGTAAIEAEIDLRVAETNQIYAASGVHHRLALVYTSEVEYAEETGDELYHLWNPSSGHMDEVHVWRDQVGADLVHLIFRLQPGDKGGVGRIGDAFSITCLRCGNPVFTHEIGHNMGLRHDRYQVHHNEIFGVSAHPAYGYVNQRAFEAGASPSKRWTTIMSYSTQCDDAGIPCNLLVRFSNAQQQYDGDPLGIPYGGGRV